MANETEKVEAKAASDEGEPKATRASSALAKSKKKKKSAAEVQKELAEIGRSQEERPPVDLKKIYTRVGLVALVIWVIALIVPGWIPKAIAGVLTVVAIGVMFWLDRYVKKTQALGAILKGADTEEGRKKALERLDTEFKKGDTQAVIAKAQLQMQEDPRAALATLETVNVDKELAPIAGQVRAMRAMLHLTLGETAEARALADKLELGKQQEPKTRLMFAAVAGEAWARSGQGRKAVDTLELFNPDDPEHEEMKAQMWRARAFAYAAINDTKGIARSLKKLADINPHLLGMFLPPQKKVHPLLEREAKQMVSRLGIVQRKMVRQKN
ncbi:MAG TPA: hypothetical protein VM925_38190 [Labilithrix sp.]|nr:hypothetical protein [Labilithrix sp.]